jgi:GNAT superfamily N-acetyltransferase
VYLEGADRAPAIEAHWREWHSSRARDAHFAHVEQALASPWGRRAWRVAGLRDKGGNVLATAYVYDLHYRLGSQRLRLGGVAAFCVRPELRELGLGTRLLQALHEQLRAEEFDGAALYSRIGREYYERLGYRRLPQRALEAQLVDGQDPRFEVTPSLLRDYESRDFSGVRNIYNTSSALQRWAFLREDEYWQHRIEGQQQRARLFPRGQSRPLFLVGERDGHIVSYLRASATPEGDLLHVLEYGFEPGARDDVPALVTRAALECAPVRPQRARALAPTRLANLLPARAPTWHSERRSLFMLKSFGAFEVPSDVPQDDRLVWASDRF